MPRLHPTVPLFALLTLTTFGCESTGDLAVNTYESIHGTTSGLIQAGPEETLDAVKAATAEYNVTIYEVDTTHDPLAYKVHAEEEDGRNITITIKQHASGTSGTSGNPGSPGVTRLSVRVGFLGDDKKNDVLYERIAERLGLEPKAAVK